MWSSERARALLLAGAGALFGATFPSIAAAQPQQAQGFAVERLYTSAPGGGWFVMDDLNLFGRLGGGVSMTTGYARNPLRIPNGSQSLSVVSDEAFVDFGFAVTYDRLRLYFDFDSPVLINGDSGVVGGYQFMTPTAPPPAPAHFVDLGSNPDTLSDTRIGFDERLIGEPGGPFRLGAGAQLWIPSGFRTEYDTDDTYRAMFRALFAGDVGIFTYAGQVGFHLRPLDDAPTPQSPQGSELLFGAAAGAKLPVNQGSMAFVVGPEVWGASAFRSLFGGSTTALEGLLGARFEGTAADGPQLRAKLGAGLGIHDEFGAPEWRVVFGIELFDHGGDRDGDGVSDSKDACPDVVGPGSGDPKTNGCPRRP